MAISEEAAAFGLYYAPDPSSQIACIGGKRSGELG
jgi:FAD/FMN-containing dehydrogenase